MHIVGIDIKSYGIFYVVLQSTIQTPLLIDQGFYPLSLELNENQRKIEISTHLKSIVEKYPQHSYSYSFSIPQNQISVHNLSFPFRERFKIKRSLPFEIEENIPFSMENILYSPKFAYTQGGQTYILTYVTPQVWVEEFLQFIKKTISPSYLIPRSAALANIFENFMHAPPQWKDGVQPDQLKIYLSYENSMALVLSQKRVILDSQINWNLQSCIEEISSKYRRNLDQSLEFFFQNAFITHEEGTHLVPLLTTIKKSISDLKHQIQLLYLHLKGMGFESIKEIHILGPGGQIQNLTTHLFEVFKTPVHVFDQHPSYTSIKPSHFIALGTALSGLQKPKNPPVNLMDHFKNTSASLIQISEKRKKLFQICAAVFFSLMVYSGFRNYQSERLLDHVSETFSQYSRKIAGLRTRSISIENVEKFIQQKQKSSRMTQIYDSIPSSLSPMEFLKTLSLSILDADEWNLEVSQFEINKNKVSLQGFISKNYFEDLKTQLKTLSSNNTLVEENMEGSSLFQETPQEENLEAQYW